MGYLGITYWIELIYDEHTPPLTPIQENSNVWIENLWSHICVPRTFKLIRSNINLFLVVPTRIASTISGTLKPRNRHSCLDPQSSPFQ